MNLLDFSTESIFDHVLDGLVHLAVHGSLGLVTHLVNLVAAVQPVGPTPSPEIGRVSSAGAAGPHVANHMGVVVVVPFALFGREERRWDVASAVGVPPPPSFFIANLFLHCLLVVLPCS